MRYLKRSCIVASRTRLESMAATTSSSFSWEVTTIHTGEIISPACTRLFPTRPNSSMRARRSSILLELWATYWPTSSIMNTTAFPGQRLFASSNVRFTTLRTVISDDLSRSD